MRLSYPCQYTRNFLVFLPWFPCHFTLLSSNNKNNYIQTNFISKSTAIATREKVTLVVLHRKIASEEKPTHIPHCRDIRGVSEISKLVPQDFERRQSLKRLYAWSNCIEFRFWITSSNYSFLSSHFRMYFTKDILLSLSKEQFIEYIQFDLIVFSIEQSLGVLFATKFLSLELLFEYL